MANFISNNREKTDNSNVVYSFDCKGHSYNDLVKQAKKKSGYIALDTLSEGTRRKHKSLFE